MLSSVAVVLALFGQRALSDTLYFVNKTHYYLSPPPDPIIAFDTYTKTITHEWPTDIQRGDTDSYVDVECGALVCNYADGSQFYYGLYNGDYYGVFSFNVGSGKMEAIAKIDNGYYDPFVIECTSTKNQILAVTAEDDGGYYAVGWYLDELTWSESGDWSRRNIMKFDSNATQSGLWFSSFNTAANELWATLGKWHSATSNTLQIVDTVSGKVKATYAYPENYGVPLFTLPQTLKDNTFNAAVVRQGQGVFVKLQMNNGELKEVSATAAEYLYTLYHEGWYGQVAVCNATGYVITGLWNNITSFDIFTGTKTTTFDIRQVLPGAFLGDLACI